MGEDNVYMSFLTCEPNGMVGAIKRKVMTVKLDRGSFSRWLDDSPKRLRTGGPYADEKVMVLA